MRKQIQCKKKSAPSKGKRIKIEVEPNYYSIDKLVENGDIFNENNGKYYAELETMEELIQLVKKFYDALDSIYGLIIRKELEKDEYSLFVYDDWIE